MFCSSRQCSFVPLVAASLMIAASTSQAQILEVNGSPNQIGISKVYLTDSSGQTAPCVSNDGSPRWLNVVGYNFDKGNAPQIYIDLANKQALQRTTGTAANGPYFVQVACSNVFQSHRIVVTTGNGPVYNDEVSFDFSVVGPQGVKGATGATGATGPVGDVGPTINVNCVTGGDARSLSNGRMSVIGVNALVQ